MTQSILVKCARKLYKEFYKASGNGVNPDPNDGMEIHLQGIERQGQVEEVTYIKGY